MYGIVEHPLPSTLPLHKFWGDLLNVYIQAYFQNLVLAGRLKREVDT